MTAIFDKHTCTNCQEDIPGVHIHCIECEEFELCIPCFSAGAEIGQHKRTHKYGVISGFATIFKNKGTSKEEWSALEEIRLLDSIEQYGFGNWEDISKHIETRGPEEAKQEYINRFLTGTIGRKTWSSVSDHRPKLEDHSSDDNGPLSYLTTQKLPPIDVSLEEAAQLGYMPNRDDFEREYDPSAEQLVSNLSLGLDDEDVDLVLKLAQVDIYTRRLRERARRKRLVRDYQLIMSFFRGGGLIGKKTKQTKEQRDFRDRFRVFAQFLTSTEFEGILGSMEREKMLRLRMSELCRYRWNGLTRLDECIHFEQHAAAAQHRNTGPYGQGRTDNRTIGERHPSSMHFLQRKGENERLVSNSVSQKGTYHIGGQVSCEESSLNKNYSDSGRTIGVTSSVQSSNHVSDQIQQPGSQLLSSNEIQLCSALNMPPTVYISMKTVILSGAPQIQGSHQEESIRKYLMKSGFLPNQIVTSTI